MPFTRITPPAEMPVSPEDLKAHLRIETSVEDAPLSACLEAATALLDGPDGILGRALVTQVWRYTTTPDEGCVHLPLAPVAAVTDGSHGTSVTATLKENERGPYVILDGWNGGEITLDVMAGYGAAADVPPPLKHAIRLLAGHWYANREATSDDMTMRKIPYGVNTLIAPYRRIFA